MAPGGRRDPFTKFHFNIEVEGLVVGGFQEVTGLQSEIEVQEYREGGVNTFTHKFAGPVKYTANLVLKAGLSDLRGLWNWYCDVTRGQITRKNISVLLLDEEGQEKRRWDFEKAYPVKWVGSDFRAAASEVAVETIELVHRGLMRG